MSQIIRQYGLNQLAMAETLATVAATLDQHGEPCHIADRLQAFSEHVQKDYGRLNYALWGFQLKLVYDGPT